MTFDAHRRSRIALTHDAVHSKLESITSEFETTPPRNAGELLNGRYLILAPVGAGGMGHVYRVHDALHPERELALKTLDATSWQATRIELFKAEFSTMSALSHPNIARVHDFEVIAGSTDYAFTMEYIEGRDLLAATEGQSLEQILAWTVDACRALHYLHLRGVVHADFKPQNVLVTADGRVKVLDFGLSGGVLAGMLLGTPAYMAPELARGGAAHARVDLYALGVTLYQLIFRRPPFLAESLDDLLTLHEHAPLSFPAAPAIDARLRAILERLCAKAPEARFASANAVIEALCEATGHAYQLETPETQRSYVSGAPLIGRENETQALLAHCLARADGAVLATVSGVSGVGKSRLVREVRRQLQLVGVPFLEAACYEGSFSELEPLEDWAAALGGLARAHRLDSIVAAHAQTLDWLRAGGQSIGRRSLTDEEALRMTRLRDLADFVLDLSQSLSLVLYLDDLQWGRTSTTDFLKLLCQRQTAREEAGGRSLATIIVSYREDEVAGRPLEDLLKAVKAERRCAITLAPLAPSETARLIGSMLGTSAVPEAFSARVNDETGGNPYFIEEILRALMERGDVYLQSGQWAARAEVARLEIPHTVAAVLERRLSALDPSLSALLEWLAVYAQPMPLHVLAEASGLGPEATAAGVARLVERQLVTPLGQDRVRTSHDKLREFLYERHDRAQRIHKHHTVAVALNRLAKHQSEFVFERAHHHWYAGDKAESQVWAEAAARLGEQTFAIDVAIDNHERLAALADERRDERRRRAALDRLLELCTVTGQYDRIVALSQSELARRPERLEHARIYQMQGEALGCSGRLQEGLELLYRSAALAGGAVPRTRGRRRLFIAWHFARHLLLLASRRDLVVPEALGDEERRRREILGKCYLQMSVYCMLSGDDEGFGVSFAGINATLPIGRHEVQTKLLHNIMLGHHLFGRYASSRRLAREAQKLSESEVDRALLVTVEVLCRQATQEPVYPEQLPVAAYETELIKAIDLLSTRSKALYVHLSRTVATTLLCQCAPRFQYRPEILRWAEAMVGTVHYSFVQGEGAFMALVDGQRERALAAYALAQKGNTTTFYRAWVDIHFGFACAVRGDVARAVTCMRAVAQALATMDTRVTSALWVPAGAICVLLLLRARGVFDGWILDCVRDCVARLERTRRRLPVPMRLLQEAGRLVLGRSSLASLRALRDRSHVGWRAEPMLAGHFEASVAAALALARAGRADCRAAAPEWTRELLEWCGPLFPADYIKHLTELLP